MGHLNQGLDPRDVVMFPEEPSGDADIWFDKAGQPAWVRVGDYWFKADHHCWTNHAELPIRLLCVRTEPPVGMK